MNFAGTNSLFRWWMLALLLVPATPAASLLHAAETKSSAVSADEPASPLGHTVSDFTLSDFRGKSHALSDYRESRIVVIAVLGTECPLAKLYSPRLAQLAEEFQDQGVQFLGLNANRQDSITEIAEHARVHQLSFPILKDLGNRIVDQLGAVRTPEVFVLDEQRIVRYWGRIDDQYGVGFIRDEPTRQDLKAALQELLAGKRVSQPLTEGVGCFIGRIRAPKANAEVTYSDQVARIFQKRCVECHREGEIAPFTLTSYEDAVGWAETIAEVIDDERMPPWHADPKHGKFTNDRRLSDKEKSLIHQWVRDGAPQGNPADAPPALTFPEGWQLPRLPDLVVAMRDEPFTVPAESGPRGVRYQYFSVKLKWTEDKWVQAVEARPGNRAVVHHILVFVQPPAEKSDSKLGDTPGAFLAAYVPGLRATPFPTGMAKRIPAGSKLVFQVHYTPNGSVQEDLSQVGLIFADPKDVTHLVVTGEARNSRSLTIPPHAENHRLEATSPAAPVDTQLLNFLPHMHLRGKSFQYAAVLPDGSEEILLDVPRYDFNWQTVYWLAEPRPLSAGTKLHCIAHFDNSSNNPANPDPSATVRWGDQTWNEMLIGYFDVAIPLQAVLAQPDKAADGRQKAEATARKLLKRFDKNMDGKVMRDEVSGNAVAIFNQVDANSDGVVTLEELIEAAGLLMRR